MFEGRRNPSPAQASAEIVEAFATASTSIISDNLARLPGAGGVRPFHKPGRTMVGTALTVRTRPGDNLVIHQALELVRPGDVIVVDGGGETNRALFGEIMMMIAQSRGAAGVVIDGAIRDVGTISRSDFPCFARAANHKGPYKDGPGEINVPIALAGMVVEAGDIIVGDEDGVVAFPQSWAESLLEAVRAQTIREAEILQSIREGRYQGAYGGARAN